MDFAKHLRKITELLGFPLTFKAAELHDIPFKTLGVDIRVKFDKLFLFKPLLILDASSRKMFIESIKKSTTLSFDYWIADRKTIGTQLEFQIEKSTAQRIIFSKQLIVAHQTAARRGVPNKANKIALFDNLIVRKYHVDIDSVRLPRDGVSIEYNSKD